MRAGCQPAGSTIFDRLSEETTNQPARLDDQSQGHKPKGITADRMTSSRQVRRIYPEFFLPPGPHTFLQIGYRAARAFRGYLLQRPGCQLCRGMNRKFRLEYVLIL
jgi:hypothetical protein